MLRLWPETLHAGLFPGHAWLAGGTRREPLQRHPAAIDGAGLLNELQAMFALLPPSAGRRRHLHLLVSDSLAAVTTLPWQERLHGQGEMAAYADACFERGGLTLDGSWVKHNGFRQFRHAGIAYALPQAWLSALVAMCAAHQVRLQSVLPVSAASYWRLRRQPKRGVGWLLLTEARRVTGLVYRDGSLAAIDVQPVTSDTATAGARLLRRLSARYPAPLQVRYWSPDGAVASSPPSFIGTHLTDAAVIQLGREAWN